MSNIRGNKLFLAVIMLLGSTRISQAPLSPQQEQAIGNLVYNNLLATQLLPAERINAIMPIAIAVRFLTYPQTDAETQLCVNTCVDQIQNWAAKLSGRPSNNAKTWHSEECQKGANRVLNTLQNPPENLSILDKFILTLKEVIYSELALQYSKGSLEKHYNGLRGPGALKQHFQQHGIQNPNTSEEDNFKWFVADKALYEHVLLPLTYHSPILDDGTVPFPDGTRILVDGTVQFPNGARMLVDGTIQLPDGAVPLPDGAGMLPGGAVPLPGGAGMPPVKNKFLEKLDRALIKHVHALAVVAVVNSLGMLYVLAKYFFGRKKTEYPENTKRFSTQPRLNQQAENPNYKLN